MFPFECDTIRVDVPVGRMLTAPQEIEVNIDRDAEGPLAIKLRLIPARASEEHAPRMAAEPHVRRRKQEVSAFPHEYGGGD